MTEQEWLQAADPKPMLKFLRGKVSDRKMRLFAVACCRAIWELSTDPWIHRAAAIAERLVDNDSMQAAQSLAYYRQRVGSGRRDTSCLRACALAAAAVIGVDAKAAAFEASHWARYARNCELSASNRREEIAQAKFLRDIIGNPFRPLTLDPAWLAWHSGLLVSMARQMYDSREFTDMPVMADALEEAGCTDQDILSHCRGPGPHVRGCWVVDLLLGKE
jgi:hypothetical protein